VALRIGIDFDNTIVGYDQAFVSLAIDLELIQAGSVSTKTQLRSALRARTGGEQDWQRLQGRIYGAEMERAEMISGVGDFLQCVRKCEDEVFIISHKTEFGHYDPDRVNLRDAARDWMEVQGFFSLERYAIEAENVFFLSTREEKVDQISALNLDWFIDDLPEVLSANGFPESVRKILFTNGADSSEANVPYIIKRCWNDIQDEIYP